MEPASEEDSTGDCGLSKMKTPIPSAKKGFDTVSQTTRYQCSRDLDADRLRLSDLTVEFNDFELGKVHTCVARGAS